MLFSGRFAEEEADEDKVRDDNNGDLTSSRAGEGEGEGDSAGEGAGEGDGEGDEVDVEAVDGAAEEVDVDGEGEENRSCCNSSARGSSCAMMGNALWYLCNDDAMANKERKPSSTS